MLRGVLCSSLVSALKNVLFIFYCESDPRDARHCSVRSGSLVVAGCFASFAGCQRELVLVCRGCHPSPAELTVRAFDVLSRISYTSLSINRVSGDFC